MKMRKYEVGDVKVEDASVEELLARAEGETAADAPPLPSLNGLECRRHDDTSTVVFVPLPRALWRQCDPGESYCSCPFCKREPGRIAYWDTLAIATKPTPGRPWTTWTVHYPEINLDKLREGEIDKDGRRA